METGQGNYATQEEFVNRPLDKDAELKRFEKKVKELQKENEELRKEKAVMSIELFVTDLETEKVFIEDFDPALIDRLRRLLKI